MRTHPEASGLWCMAKLKKHDGKTERAGKSKRGRPKKKVTPNDKDDRELIDRKIQIEEPTSDQNQTPALQQEVGIRGQPSATQTPIVASAKPRPLRWADVAVAELESVKKQNEKIRVHHNPNFQMQLDESAVAAEEVEFSDEELEEGSNNWKLTLIECVAGTEVSWVNMDKYVRARWKGINPPTLVKQNGVFLFQFQSHDNFSKVYEAMTYFVFLSSSIAQQIRTRCEIWKEYFRSLNCLDSVA